MFARVAVWSPMPDDDRQWVIDAAKGREIGWHDQPRPAPASETIYRVIRHG